jgi:hypothetical protein
MTWILVLIIVVAVLLAILKAKLESLGAVKHSDNNYVINKSLFSPAERSFYGVLQQAVGEKALVFAKVRVADVITPKKGLAKSGRQIALNKITRKHFDFILCNKDDLSFICGIELNDKSHQAEERRKRDEFLVTACESAKFPLIYVNNQSSYNINEIKGDLSGHIPGLVAEPMVDKVAQVIDEKPPEILSMSNITKHDELKSDTPSCPKCSSELVRRLAKKGAHAGKEFWACKTYPKCKHIEQIV